MNASTTVLCFDAKLIFYDKRCISRARSRLARSGCQGCNHRRRVAVWISHEQRQIVCVFRGIVVPDRRTNSKLVKRHGCSFCGLHSVAATVQINRLQAPTDADNLCVGYLLCHSSSTLCNIDSRVYRVLEERGEVHTHTKRTCLNCQILST